MQPDEQKVDFQSPQESNYYSPAPVERDQEANPAPMQSSAPEQPLVQASVPAEQVPTTDQQQASLSELPVQEPVHWQAPEYLHYEKNPLWYVGFAIVVIALTAAAVFLIQSWTFAILVPVMAAALMAYSHRPPRQMDYVVSAKGIYINDTLHSFAEFKSFGVIHDDAEYSISFIPVRRFRPSLSVYFPEEKGEAIVDFLGVRLPMQPLKLDGFDKIVRFLGL